MQDQIYTKIKQSYYSISKDVAFLTHTLRLIKTLGHCLHVLILLLEQSLGHIICILFCSLKSSLGWSELSKALFLLRIEIPAYSHSFYLHLLALRSVFVFNKCREKIESLLPVMWIVQICCLSYSILFFFCPFVDDSFCSSQLEDSECFCPPFYLSIFYFKLVTKSQHCQYC